MGVLFGIFNLDGAPVDPRDLGWMRRGMAGWESDGHGVWHEGPVGLGCLLLRNTPEAQQESFPLTSKIRQLALTAAARLDNRDELAAQLELPGDRSLLSDGSLLLSAYRKWETDCPPRLLGDWAVAVWDGSRKQLFLARDHFGATGLYYYRDGRRFAFASSIRGLLALPDVPRRLNPTALPDQGFPEDAATAYAGIFRLTPAQALTVHDGMVRVWQYWSPLDAPAVRCRSDREYLEAFEAVYGEAVRCRLRCTSNVGLMLSGGLDSSSIAALAAPELARRGQRLKAFTSAPLYDVSGTTPEGRNGDESAETAAVSRQVGNTDLLVVRGETLTPLAAVERALEVHGLPHGIANHIWILEILSAARSQKVGVLLDGWGGNLTISWTGNRERYLRELLLGCRWGEYARELSSWRRARPGWRSLAGQLVRPLSPPMWKEHLRRLRPAQPRLLRRSALRGSAGGRPGATSDRTAVEARNPGLQYYLRNGLTALAFELGSAFGIEIRQPAMDRRVIEFCMGLPEDQHSRDGQDRLLVRRAMAGRLPDDVLWYRKRGIQSADIAQRLVASRDEVETALRRLENAAAVREILDLPLLRRAFDAATREPAGPEALPHARYLVRGLGLGLFVLRVEHG